MGQATLDLPDPLEPAAAPATPAAADDLLAQLANDEIDRLLAEAEFEPEKHGKPAPAANAPPRSPAVDAAFDAALKGAAGSQPSPQAQTLPVVANAPAPPAPSTLSQQMQQVFAGTTPVTAAAPDVIDVPGVAKIVDAKVIDTQLAPSGPAKLANNAELTPVVVAPVDGGTSLAERDGLRAGEIEALTADPLGELDEPESEARVPLVLKPLVWINAPFAAVPEGAREALGKVAIVTLVNAIGVLAYVLIFRKH
jgi:hypothetical protein